MKYDAGIDLSTDNAPALILKRIAPGTRVLEFGPATGYMTRYLTEELGCKVDCVEIDAAAAERAQAYCETMIVGDIEDYAWQQPLLGREYDFILFTDVLEHLRDPSKALRCAAGFLHRDGKIMISTPNIAHNAIIMELLQGDFNYRSHGILDDTHVRFFTRKTLLQLLKEADLYPAEWLAVELHPEYTEFAVPYSLFPDPVAALLQQRADGHVYQYVTVAGRQAAIGAAAVEQLCQAAAAKPLGVTDDFLQLFWATDAGFAEERSRRIPLRLDRDFHTYECALPDGWGQGLRLDPGTRPAYGEIKEILIFAGDTPPGPYDRPSGEISAATGFAGLLPGKDVSVLDCQSTYNFLCTHDDPQLQLTDVPGILPSGPLHVRITLRLERQLTPLLGNAVKLTASLRQQQLAANAVDLQRNQVEIDRRDQELARKEMELAQKNGELNRKENELARKENELQSKAEALRDKAVEIQVLCDKVGAANQEAVRLRSQLDEILYSSAWKLVTAGRRLRDVLLLRKRG